MVTCIPRVDELSGASQSQTVLRFGFDPRTDVFGFCFVFWYHNNLLMNGTKNGSWS